MPRSILRGAFLALLPAMIAAQVTVYSQIPLVAEPTATGTAAAADYSGQAASDPSTLIPPDLPNPLPNLNYDIQLVTGGTPGVSIVHPSPFFGFSIEMSVSNQVLGRNGTFSNVPLLNLLSAVAQRSGEVHIRVGGNTQESATLVESLSDNKMLEKDYTVVSGTTNTPPIVYTPELLYLMSNISSFVNVKWYLGIPFNDTNFRMDIVKRGEEILGDNILGFQAGNEPDFYPGRRRAETYSPTDYFNEVGELLQVMQDSQYDKARSQLIVPSIATQWSFDDVWNTGIIDAYNDNIKFMALERYPTDNCFFQFGSGVERHPQDMFPQFLNHTSAVSLVSQYVAPSAYALSKNKPLVMFETNTASCGGFPGLSNSFGAALWGLDYGLQMAYTNFSQALLHVGGQSVYYNPFTAPPTNQSTFHQWTVGPMMYSTLIMAEIIGKSGKAQVLDLNANAGDIWTPAYSIYEDGVPVRLALFNFMTDSTHAADVTAWIAVGGGQSGQDSTTPTSIKVKYFLSNSTAQLFDYTWAGQTWGSSYQSDGILKGTEDIQTIQCDTTQQKCAVKVPSPGFALVFLSDNALSESSGQVETFSTTAYTKTHNTASIDPSVLATSNGHSGKDFKDIGSTSSGSNGAVGRHGLLTGLTVCGALAFGGLLIGRALVA